VGGETTEGGVMSDIKVVDPGLLLSGLDWNRLRSGDNRALDPEHQDVFDMVERLREELDGADRIANGWQKQNIELRHLLRFFFENVPVQYHESYADVMTRTKEILGHHE
jgi:hypothetical protein